MGQLQTSEHAALFVTRFQGSSRSPGPADVWEWGITMVAAVFHLAPTWPPQGQARCDSGFAPTLGFRETPGKVKMKTKQIVGTR